MPRANRYFIPGYIWHITHRCHKRDFLLKFDQDKKRWLYWLFQAKKRFSLPVLNYCVTSNHIHLLAYSKTDDAVAKSMQLVAGRVAQEYNLRKKRSGSFWEDRYHATIVMQNEHLFRCLRYIDLNMNRAGVVNHPREYPYTGFNEIVSPPQRYSLIDRKMLKSLCGFSTIESFVSQYKEQIDQTCLKQQHRKDPKWTKSVAVGDAGFISEIKEKLGFKVKERKTVIDEESCFLRVPAAPYSIDFDTKNGFLSSANMVFWDF